MLIIMNIYCYINYGLFVVTSISIIYLASAIVNEVIKNARSGPKLKL